MLLLTSGLAQAACVLARPLTAKEMLLPAREVFLNLCGQRQALLVTCDAFRTVSFRPPTLLAHLFDG